MLKSKKTWIDLDEGSRIEFLSAGKGFILKSDKDGWENLYYHDATGKLINQITTGTLWGTSITKIDEKTKLIYFKARKENSARFDFYKVGLDGKGLTRLSFGDFSHDQVNLSPNGKYFYYYLFQPLHAHYHGFGRCQGKSDPGAGAIARAAISMLMQYPKQNW